MTTDASSTGGTDPRRTPRRRRFVPFLILGGVFLVWGTLAAVDSLRIAREVRAGRAEFANVVDAGLSGSADREARSAAAARRFETARRISARSPWIGTWARLPLVGRPARWLRAATAVTESLAHDAAATIRRLEPSIDSFGGGTGRVAFLETLENEFVALRMKVGAVHLPGAGGFVPPISAAERELRGDLGRIRAALDDGIAAARGLRSLLQGPSTYLVLAANNAEMRAGGMVLQAGLLYSEGGRLAAGGFRSTAQLVLPSPVPLPSEIQGLYGWLDPGTEWRNVGSSPNFPAVAPIYASMARRTGIRHVDGVLQIDVIGVRALLAVVGPVEVSGRTYDASNVESLVLHDLYVVYGKEQVERRQEFSRLAAATFQALNSRAWKAERLGDALRDAVAGRHLLLWSNREIEQNAWRRLRADGSLPRDGLMLTVQNHTGNKLDWFIRPSMELGVEQRSGGWRRIHLRIRIENPTPPGEPKYVAGDGALVPPGAHRALVAVYLPGWATNIEMPGQKVALVGPDGLSRVVGTRVDIVRGASVVVEVTFSAPPGIDHVLLLPSARVRPTTLRFDGSTVGDGAPRVVPI